MLFYILYGKIINRNKNIRFIGSNMDNAHQNEDFSIYEIVEIILRRKITIILLTLLAGFGSYYLNDEYKLWSQEVNQATAIAMPSVKFTNQTRGVEVLFWDVKDFAIFFEEGQYQSLFEKYEDRFTTLPYSVSAIFKRGQDAKFLTLRATFPINISLGDSKTFLKNFIDVMNEELAVSQIHSLSFMEAQRDNLKKHLDVIQDNIKEKKKLLQNLQYNYQVIEQELEATGNIYYGDLLELITNLDDQTNEAIRLSDQINHIENQILSFNTQLITISEPVSRLVLSSARTPTSTSGLLALIVAVVSCFTFVVVDGYRKYKLS